MKHWTIGFVAELLTQAQAQGGTQVGVEPRAAAIGLMSMFDGLTLAMLAENLGAGAAVEAFEQQLDQILNDIDVAALLPQPTM